MKRRLFCLLLAFVLLLLCGCGSSTNTDPTSGTSTAGTDIYHQKVMDRMEKVQFRPPYEGEPLLEYDPDSRVYIALGEMDLDFYPNTAAAGNSLSFWVISLDPFDKSEIRVEIPVQTEYTVSVLDASQMCHGTIYHDGIPGNFGLTEQQYLCMAGVDFLEQDRLAHYASICVDLLEEYQKKAYEEKKTAEEIKASAEYQFYYNTQLEYWAKWREPSEQYKSLSKEELPMFYAYHVSILFAGLGSHEETVKSLTVAVGQERHEMEIGQWRLHTQTPQDILDYISQNENREVSVGGGATNRLGYYPGPNGYKSVSFDFVAKEDMTITGTHPLIAHGEPVRIQGGNVEIYEMVDGKQVLVLDYLWDTKSPLTFEEGQIIRIQLTFQDDRLKAYYVGFYGGIFLDYTYREKDYTGFYETRMYREGHPWDIYLMVFEGIDVGEWYYYQGTDDRPAWLRDTINAE